MNYRLIGMLMFIAASANAQDLKGYDQKIPGTSIILKMKAIPEGSFNMGASPADKNAKADERPAKAVSVSSFWMSATEITFSQWDAFFKDNALPQNKGVDGVTRPTPQYIDLTWGMGRSDNQPINSLSQQAALMYCKWLYSKTGVFFRLPTEAEWEYACKAGSTKLYSFGNDARSLKEYGVYTDNSAEKFHTVAEKKANGWGLYDMLGNLTEWTLDQYDAEYLSKSLSKDPLNPPASKYPKVLKGGSYLDGSQDLRCSARFHSEPGWNKRDPQIPKSRWWLTDAPFTGFRVVRPALQPRKEEIEKFFGAYLK